MTTAPEMRTVDPPLKRRKTGHSASSRQESDQLYYERNKERIRERKRRWCEQNPEKVRESQRRWRKQNPEKVRERKQRWREQNREKENERNRRYREQNPEKERERSRRWREQNPEKAREGQQRYREQNPEKEHERSRRWREQNPEKLRESKRRYQKGMTNFTTVAKKRGLEVTLSEEDLTHLYGQSCIYCGTSDTDIGIDRMNNRLGYTWNNSVPSCSMCNMMKETMSYCTFICMARCIAGIHRGILPRLQSLGDRRATRAYPSTYRRGANTRGLTFQLTKDEFKKLIAESCHYCGLEQARGIDRKDNKGGYTTENCLPCCKTCNRMKWTSGYEEFLDKCAAIAMKHPELIFPPPQKMCDQTA